jgi:ribosomal protein S18 acetylase RimI-like enzyme
MSITLRNGDVTDVPALEPVWVSVHRHHSQAMPYLGDYVDAATSWAERRRLYIELLDKHDTALLLAADGNELVGYGLAHVMPVAETWLADTWKTGLRIGEIESLGVLPEHRGQGIGQRLLDGLEAALAAVGVEDLIVGALAGNAAIRLYERHGYRPTWTYLSRLSSRSGR